MPSKKPAIQAYLDENEYRKIRWAAKSQGISMSKFARLQLLHHKMENTRHDLTEEKKIHARINQLGDELKSALENGDNVAVNEILPQIEKALHELGKEVRRIGTNNNF